MGMKTNNLLYVGIFIAIALIVTGYLILKDDNRAKDQILTTNDSDAAPIEITKNVIKPNITTSIVKHNVKPQFKVGDKFEYEIQGSAVGATEWNENNTMKIKLEVLVEKIDRIEGEDCYMLVSNRITEVPKERYTPNINALSTPNQQKDERITMRLQKRKDCIHKDTGKILKTVMQEGALKDGKIQWGPPIEMEIPKETSEETWGNIIFYPWMLALDDEFRMEVNTSYDTEGLTTREVSVFKVVGREKVNGRDCFRIETRVIDKNTNRVVLRENTWIDVKKRILVKSETYKDDLKIMELNLVSKL